MVFSPKKTGIHSCKLSLFLYAVAIETACGILILLCSRNTLDLSLLFNVRSTHDVYTLGYDPIQYGGLLHLMIAIATLGVLVLTHFVASIFKIVMIVISVLQTVYCSFTVTVCFCLLQGGYSSVKSAIELLSVDLSAVDLPLLDGDEINFLILEKRSLLFVVGLLATMALSLYHRAQMMKGDECVTETMIVAPSLSIGSSIAFSLLSPCRDYKTFVLGFFWFLACMAGEAITTISGFFCLRPLKITMIIVHASMFILSLATIGLCAKIYTRGSIDYASYYALIKGKVGELVEKIDPSYDYSEVETLKSFFSKVTTDHTDEQISTYMGNGVFLVVVAVLATVCVIFSIISILYSVFRLLDLFGDDKSQSSQDASNKGVYIVLDRK